MPMQAVLLLDIIVILPSCLCPLDVHEILKQPIIDFHNSGIMR